MMIYNLEGGTSKELSSHFLYRCEGSLTRVRSKILEIWNRLSVDF